MSLEIKHVADLMGMKFRIPSYQRGYRWERKQIEQLLDDLVEFSDSIEEIQDRDEENDTNDLRKMGYYCLQPLVVTKQGGCYDVIDGQQRLTTIYLILFYFSAAGSVRLPYNPEVNLVENLYEMSYESRKYEFFKEKLFSKDSDEAVDNIDFYFMSKAYTIIKEWFKRNPTCRIPILELLLPHRYKPSADSYVKSLDDKNKRLHDVRFIWYETPAASSIQTFNNLNYGKIGLTAAELVKALLFECDRAEAANRDIEKGTAFTRSLQWSAMEESLQDLAFWGMLVPEKDTMSVHLELILQFVAKDIDEKLNYTKSDRLNEKDADWTFIIFSKAITDDEFVNIHGNKLSECSQRVEDLWNRIRKVYTVFRNWYNDRHLYHWIGLYVLLSVCYKKESSVAVLRRLYQLYLSDSKIAFKDSLRRKIGELVCINAKAESKKDSQNAGKEESATSVVKGLKELNYNDDADDIRKILLLFNVELTRQNEQEGSRFPFHLVAKSIRGLNSIEHIHPQHFDFEGEDVTYGVVKDWFDKRVKILKNEVKLSQDLQNAIDRLNEILENDEQYKKNKTACEQELGLIDTRFDELAGMRQEIMHSLCNLALVDQATNSSLGNQLLDAKRARLIEISKPNADGKTVTFVPIGTWHAFNKHYTQPQSITDLKFWTEPDREAYFAEIKKIYDMFTVSEVAI